ncbi:MAG TPA: aminopeptidase [Saprospiraceae bacterium]|nr:aminopeptidase [Saprospiraceae bacterium]
MSELFTPDQGILEKYAHLLLNYCLQLKEGQRLFVSTSILAEPLLQHIHREASRIGAAVEYDLSFKNKSSSFWQEATGKVLDMEPTFHQYAMEHFDAYLAIRAPYDLYEDLLATADQKKRKATAGKKANDFYFSRTADGSMVRSLCQYPTQASAEVAGMTLHEYADFVFKACRLDEEDPVNEWLNVRKSQQGIVDFLNTCDEIRYKNEKTDIRFSVKNRIWINSDGRANMPSGEVFTGPVEDSVEGVVHFDFPSVFSGHDVKGITLKVQNGKIIEWSAEEGGNVLDQVFAIDGARYFGEVAIGTNYKIQRPTKNILFDEKIGGSIHMAVGQSYLQTGGKNQSTIHWDMIAGMRNGGEIIADGNVIYRDGYFLEFEV